MHLFVCVCVNYLPWVLDRPFLFPFHSNNNNPDLCLIYYDIGEKEEEEEDDINENEIDWIM